jgi:hypothetical protein
MAHAKFTGCLSESPDLHQFGQLVESADFRLVREILSMRFSTRANVYAC